MARRGSDPPGCYEFLHLPLDLLLIGCRHSVQSVGRGGLCLVHHNGVISGSRLREAFRELGKHIGEFFQQTLTASGGGSSTTGSPHLVWSIFSLGRDAGISGNQPIFLPDCCRSRFRSISLRSSGVSSASWGVGEIVATAAASGVSGGLGKKVGFPGGTVPV